MHLSAIFVKYLEIFDRIEHIIAVSVTSTEVHLPGIKDLEVTRFRYEIGG